jgi:hypothetical protein
MIARTHDVRRIGRVMFAMTAALAAVLALTSGTRTAASALGGGVVAMANLYLIRAAVSRLIAAPRRPLAGVLAVLGKLTLGVALVAAAFSRLPIEPMPFALGVTVLLGAVLLETLVLGSPIPGEPEAHVSERPD